MTPLVVVVAAVPLFGERLRPVQLLWAALAIAGVAAVILGATDEGGNALLGDLLALGSLVAGAGMLLMMKHRRMGGVAASSYTAGVFLVAALVRDAGLARSRERRAASKATTGSTSCCSRSSRWPRAWARWRGRSAT